jgi:hypothetical protein
LIPRKLEFEPFAGVGLDAVLVTTIVLSDGSLNEG